jgi:peptide/nickel transport system permease protein
MGTYVIHRLTHALPVIVVIGFLCFAIARLAPGDPVALLVDVSLVPPAEVERLREDLGLTGPLPLQFGRMVARLATGQLRSLRTGQPVWSLLGERLPVTATLLGAGIILGTVFGVSLGVLAAHRRHTWVDHWLSIVVLGGISMPSFWLGLLLMYTFAGVLHILPASGIRPVLRLDPSLADMAPYFVLPTTALAAIVAPSVMRHTRSAMLEVLTQEYVRAARGKGLSEPRVLFRHALRNALLPVVTLVGLLVPILMGSTAIIESVFAMPGLGRLVVESAASRDYPIILTLNFLAAALVLLSSLCVDACYASLDPRLRLDGSPR